MCVLYSKCNSSDSTANADGEVKFMVFFEIDLKSRTPIYEQIYKKTVELIIKGELKENDQMPSVRALSAEISVNPNTITKAYALLEKDGIIYSLSGRGSFVAKVELEKVADFLLADFDRCALDALESGISPSILVDRINTLSKKTDIT